MARKCLVISLNTGGKQLANTGAIPSRVCDSPGRAMAYLPPKDDDSANKSWLFHGNSTDNDRHCDPAKRQPKALAPPSMRTQGALLTGQLE